MNKLSLTVITELQKFPAGRNLFGAGRGFFQNISFSVCFYLVLPPPSREGVQRNSFAGIMASGGLFLLVFDRCHLFTNGINCLSAASAEPEQIQNNLGVSFPRLSCWTLPGFWHLVAFCQTSCLHDQLTCFTNIFLAKACKLAFFYVWQGLPKKKPKVLFRFGLLCHDNLMAQEACKVSFAVFLSALSLLWILQLSSCFSSPLTVPFQPFFLFSTQLSGAETASRNISQPCGLLNTVRKQQHYPTGLCRRPKCATVLDFGIFSSSCRACTAEFIFKRSK